MVDEDLPEDDDEKDHRDNLLRRRAEEEVALKAFRLTREKDQQFSIDMGDGKEVRDRRPMKAGMGSHPTSAPTSSSQASSATPGSASAASPALPVLPAALSPAQQLRAATDPPAKAAEPHPGELPEEPKLKPVKLTPYMQARLQLQAECFGVIIQPEASTLEYIRDVNGREVSLFTEPASEQGLVAAEKNLKRITNDSINLLSAKYGVTFSKIDEVLSQAVDSGNKHAGTFGRQPSLIELDAIGEALSVSDPAHHSIARDKIRICFVDTQNLDGPPVSLTFHEKGTADLFVLPHATKLGHNKVHAVARFFVDVLAVHTVHKTGSRQIQALPNLAQHIASFRSGTAERKHLLRENRQHYDKAKEIDQWEVNKEYGLQPDGMDLKVRLPNGKLVSNKPEMREEIRRFEEDAGKH